MTSSNEELINLIDRGITESWFGDPAQGPWPNDPDGGELRIANALINVLVECEKSDSQEKSMLSTSFIRKTIDDVLILNERRMILED